jgi:hypothetical protein
LRDLRNILFRELKEVKETTIVDFRRKWIQDLLVVPSYVEVHVRWKPFDKRPTSRSVLVRKNDTLAHISFPKSTLDIITPPAASEGKNGGVDLRMNTDAALFYVSASIPNQDRVSEIYIGNLDWKKEVNTPGIGRLLATQQWIAFMPDGTRWAFPSFSAAFLYFATQDEKTNEFIKTRLN